MGIPCGAVIDKVSLGPTMKPRSFHSITILWPPCIQSDHYHNGSPGKQRSLNLRDACTSMPLEFLRPRTQPLRRPKVQYISFPTSETLELQSDRTVLPISGPLRSLR